MNNCAWIVYNKDDGIGFFRPKLLPVLINNNHVIGKKDIENNKIISLYFNNDIKNDNLN